MKKTENQKYDLFYLNEDGKKTVKESFKFILEIARPAIESFKNPKIADVGCATGDLAAYIMTLHPKAKVTGLDIQDELLSKARAEVPTVSFKQYDVVIGDSSLEGQFDVAFMCGVHATFDDPQDWLPNFLSLLQPRGVGFVYGNFNPEPIDVLVKVRPSGHNGPFMGNWNMISQKTISRNLDMMGYESAFHRFQIGIDIPKRAMDPLRSWTFKYEDGSRGTVNGAQLLHQDFLLVTRKK